MNRAQINRLYAQTPVLLWPWIWVQLVVILARLEAASLRGEDATELVGVTRWYALRVLFQSDNLSGYVAPESYSYAGNVTFASLCEAPTSMWTPFDSTNVMNPAANDNTRAAISHIYEYAEALRPVP